MTDYDADFALWATEQAALLRASRLDELDRENLADELDTLVRALHRELSGRLVRLLQNLLHWEYLPLVRLPAWYIAIQEERSAIPRLLADAPSLRSKWPTAYAMAWKMAREQASYATGLKPGVFPHEPPYTSEQALDAAFWPGDAPENGPERFRFTLRPSTALAAHQADVRRIVEANQATNPRVFGSVARGEDEPGSDLDLLVDPLPGMSLFDLGGITAELEELLGVKVDVATPNALPSQWRDQVYAEAKTLSEIANNEIERLKASADKASTAIDDTLSFVAESNQRIAGMKPET
ncbi:DUF29 family protein [Burkholderia pseudomallei]|uniref:DUF29 family protein n=1 Tax=Burkholderia pseudomallei TaxID=28450 RepID=UPI000977CCF2|nr:DUF29 family protein [Burkholderia pseudomallei]